MRHTEGPWSLDFGDDGAVVYKEGVAAIANIPDDLQSSRANARLIAAAPELLAALEEANTLLTYCADSEPMGDANKGNVWDFERVENAIQAARAAIARARGVSA